MSYSYSGDPSNNPGSITLPSDGDAESASTVQIPFEALADSVAWTQLQIQAISQFELAGQTGAVAGTTRFVDEWGTYLYSPSNIYTADAIWVVTATGMGAGQWIHES